MVQLQLHIEFLCVNTHMIVLIPSTGGELVGSVLGCAAGMIAGHVGCVIGGMIGRIGGSFLEKVWKYIFHG